MNKSIADELGKHKYILMYDDETILDAAITFKQAGGANWWYLVVDLQDGGYALTTFENLSELVEKEGEALRNRKLGELVGSLLTKVEVVAELREADYDRIKLKAMESKSRAALILEQGEVRGLLFFGMTRSATRSGMFENKLYHLAGQHYAEIPPGTYSRRRAEAMRRKRQADHPSPTKPTGG